MKIITCYKCVPDEQDIAVNNADGSLDFSKADAKISQYDLNAIEAACQLKQQAAEAQVTALSVGGKALTNAKGRKDVLSRGPDELIVVIDDQFEQALPQRGQRTSGGKWAWQLCPAGGLMPYCRRRSRASGVIQSVVHAGSSCSTT